MPIDGSYGRLNAHKQRINDMRSKRRKKTDNTSRSTRFNDPELIKQKEIDSKNLKQFKEKFNHELRIKKRKETLFSVFLILGAIISVVLFLSWIL